MGIAQRRRQRIQTDQPTARHALLVSHLSLLDFHLSSHARATIARGGGDWNTECDGWGDRDVWKGFEEIRRLGS